MMEEMKQQFLTGERALFQGHDLQIQPLQTVSPR